MAEGMGRRDLDLGGELIVLHGHSLVGVFALTVHSWEEMERSLEHSVGVRLELDREGIVREVSSAVVDGWPSAWVSAIAITTVSARPFRQLPTRKKRKRRREDR